MTHPLTELTEQMIQDALDAVDTNRPPSLVMFDETGPWTEYEREELQKFLHKADFKKALRQQENNS